MGKKLIGILIVAVILLAAGFFWYRRASKRLTRSVTPSARLAKSEPTGGAPAHAAAPAEPAGSGEKSGQPSDKIAGSDFNFSPRPGESLEYAANVTKLNSTVANLKVSVVERRTFAGKSAWHLQAFAHTENPYRIVFQLDDQFDSYSEAGNLASLQYEMHLSERGENVESVQRLLSSGKDAAPAGAAAARVLPGTRDPLGMLQYLRGTDWGRITEVRGPVYDGRKLYDVRAVLVGKAAAVIVPAGKYTAMKIEIHVLDNGAEMKDAHFLLYLSNDAARTPVLMEAVLPVASARVELTSAK